MARVSIEDCLGQIENRFVLVHVASDRTRKLMQGEPPLVRTRNKEAVTALREIADGYIEAIREEAPAAPSYVSSTNAPAV